jgi:PII-like signaling protein
MRGVMGFGQNHHVHRGRLFGVSDDRPIIIVAADEESRLRAALPALRELAPHAPMLLLDAEKLP